MRAISILAWTVVLCLLCSLGLQAQQSDPSVSDNTNLSGGSQPAAGTVPRLIKFTGVVKDPTGKVTTGVVGLTFSLYELPEGGSPLWVETQSVELDSLGRYTALLGASTPGGLPLDLFTTGKALWLGVQAQSPGQAEQPRVLLVSVPYALEAGDAATLGGKPASAYLLAAPEQSGSGMTPASTGSSTAASGSGGTGKAVGLTTATGIMPSVITGTQNYIPLFTDNSGSLGNSVMYQSSGNIGVGTANPQAPVHVYSSGSTNTTLPGFLFQRPDSTAETHFQHYYPGISYVSQNMYRDASGSGWYLDSSGTAGMAMILSTNSTVEPPNINFMTLPTGGATSPTKVMVIQSSGNVGIGTPTPSTVFQVHPASNVNIGMDSLAGVARWTMFNDAGTANIPLLLQASTFKFFNGGGAVQALTIDPSGRVGIQQPTPGFPLDVGGNINVNGNVNISGQFNSSVATGTPPFVVNSTTQVPNLNASLLGGVPLSSLLTTGANIFTGTQSVNGSVVVDQNGVNGGTLTPGMLFGSDSSGVGISSNRTNASGNQNGIDIYTGGTARVSVLPNGQVVIPTSSAIPPPPPTLFVQAEDDGYIGVLAEGYNQAPASGLNGTSAIVGTGGKPDATDPKGHGGEGIVGGGGGAPNGNGGSGVAGSGGGGAQGGNGGSFFGGNSTGTGNSGGPGIATWPGSGPAGQGPAGIFNGNVTVIGVLTKSSGSFLIDHPLDPANKYLYHSFVESPDMKNVYDGVVVLDGSGEAAVELPQWFEALNKDFRYQLTAIGAPAPGLYIATEVANNQFRIAGGAPGIKVSWQVTGTRQDAWANAHRIPVEVDKPEKEKGYYLHPELFGAPEEKQIEWARYPALMKQMKELRDKQ